MFISLDQISKCYKSRGGEVAALDPVSFGISDHEFVSIVGPSGCGKTTLLMIVSRLLNQSAGTVRIGGRTVEGPYTDLGIVFQHDVLLDWRNVMQNVMIQAEIRGLDRATLTARARQLLAMVGLEGFATMYPHELSGGMRQRVAICRALLHDPPILLMDEPFGALDALSRDQLNIDLLRLWQEMRMTVLFVTHSISEAIFLSDRVMVMSPRPGRIEADIRIELPRPRRLTLRQTPAFNDLVREVTAVFERDGVLRED
jgi:NitT/TauT family transport system ATP-binding protein